MILSARPHLLSRTDRGILPIGESTYLLYMNFQHPISSTDATRLFFISFLHQAHHRCPSSDDLLLRDGIET